MKVSLEELGICEKKIVVRYEAEETAEHYATALKMFTKFAPIAGFRKGKAPAAMVERKFRKDILNQCAEELEREGWQAFFKDHKDLSIVSEKGGLKRVPEAFDPAQAYEFSLEIVVAPAIELPDYAGLAVEARKVDASDEEVQGVIDGMLERAAEFADAEEGAAVRDGDLVGVAYEVSLDGKPLAEAVPAAEKMAKSDDYWAIANDEYSFVPGFGPALIGLKAGEEKDIAVTFDDKNAPVDALKGQTVSYHAKVNKIRTKKPAALDEQFFKRMQVKDEAELRSRVKDHITHEKLHQEWDRRREEAVAALMAKVGPVECAEYEIERDANRRVYNAVMEMARAKMPEDEIKAKRDELAAKCREDARQALARKYILDAVAAKENLSVSDRELTEAVELEAYHAGAKDLKDFAKRMKMDVAEMKDLVRPDILRGHAVTALLEKAAWTGDDAEDARKAFADDAKPVEAAE